MTTRRVVSKSRTIGRGPFNGVNVSERTEEKPLLTEDEARRLPKDDVIIVVDADMPIRAQRIKYYEDRSLRRIFESQTGELPYPEYNPAVDNYQFLSDGVSEEAEEAPTEPAAADAGKSAPADAKRVAAFKKKIKRRRRSATYRKEAGEVDFSGVSDTPENRERLTQSEASAKSLLSDLIKTIDFASSDVPPKSARSKKEPEQTL